MRKKRRWWFRVAAVAVGLTLAILLCEVAMRIYVGGRGWTPNCYATGDAFFIPDHDSGYTLRPGLRLRSSAFDVSVNTLGLRGPEVSKEKPPGVLRIAVLGGSSVFGYSVPDELSASRVLESLLRQSGITCEVLNAGVPGFNINQSTVRFEKLIATLKPDVVIVYLGWNDSVYLVDEHPDAKRFVRPAAASFIKRQLVQSTLFGFLNYRLASGTPAQFVHNNGNATITEAGGQAFQKNLNQLLDAIEVAGAQPVVCTQIMAAQEATPDDLLPYLGNTNDQVAANMKIGQWITNTVRAVAEQRQVLLLDAQSAIPPDTTVLKDAIHLTELGHAQLAGFWRDAVLPILNSETR
jgi:lysophospholipase L1-like esterase